MANEIGVIFNDGRTTTKKSEKEDKKDLDIEGDPDLVSTTGTVNGGKFKWKAAHFEWLLRIGE